MEVFIVDSKIEDDDSNNAETMWGICFRTLNEAKYGAEEEVWAQYCEDFKDYLEDYIHADEYIAPPFIEWKSIRDCWAEDTRLVGYSGFVSSCFSIVKSTIL